MSKITDLPVELINIVCEDLSRRDIQSLRLCSRELHYITDDALGLSLSEITLSCSMEGLACL